MPFLYANQWQNLCLAYEKVKNSITIIKVSKIISIFQNSMGDVSIMNNIINIIFQDGGVVDINVFAAYISNETAKVDILDRIYVGRHPEFEGGETGDITGIVNILYISNLFSH